MNTGRARRGSIRLLAGVALSILAEQATALAQASDADLRQALRSLSQQEDIGRTLAILDRAVQAEPRLGAAHLLTGDLFALMGGVQPPAALAVSPAAADQTARETRLRPPSDMSELRSDLKARAAHLLRARDTLPLNVLALGEGVDHVILIDVSAPRVFVLGRRGNGLAVEADYYASVGVMRGGKTREGDLRTPLGTYRIRAELPPSKLQRYHGAFAWVLNYPNADDRAEGRGGSNIWIHGVPPGTLTRPPFSTEGCIVLSNEDLQALRRRVRFNNALVVIAEEVVWAGQKAWQAARTKSMAAARRQEAEMRAGRPREVLLPADRSSLIALRPSEEVLVVRDAASRSSALPLAVMAEAARPAKVASTVPQRPLAAAGVTMAESPPAAPQPERPGMAAVTQGGTGL